MRGAAVLCAVSLLHVLAGRHAQFTPERCFEHGDKIFFLHMTIETRPIAAQWCALESAARMHPNIPVCVLTAHFSASLTERLGLPNRVLSRFSTEAEMAEKVLKGTKLAAWYTKEMAKAEVAHSAKVWRMEKQ
jgi:hypothetical protein